MSQFQPTVGDIRSFFGSRKTAANAVGNVLKRTESDALLSTPVPKPESHQSTPPFSNTKSCLSEFSSSSSQLVLPNKTKVNQDLVVPSVILPSVTKPDADTRKKRVKTASIKATHVVSDAKRTIDSDSDDFEPSVTLSADVVVKKIPALKPVVRRQIVDDDEEVQIMLAPAKHIGLVHAIPIPNTSIALPMKVAVTLQKLAPPVVVHQSVTTSKYFSTSKVSVSASPAKTPPKVTAALEPIVINMCDDVDVVTHDSLSSVVDPAISETLAELLSMDVPEDVAALAISVAPSNALGWLDSKNYFNQNQTPVAFMRKYGAVQSVAVKSTLTPAISSSAGAMVNARSSSLVPAPSGLSSALPKKRPAVQINISTEEMAALDAMTRQQGGAGTTESAAIMKRQKLAAAADNDAMEVDVPKPKLKWNPNAVRPAPPMAGKKDLPNGVVGCLEGLVFVFTGILDSLEREQAENLVKQYGGRVTTALSGKTSYLLAGPGGGGKTQQAIDKNVPVIDEDSFFAMIVSRSATLTEKAAKMRTSTPNVVTGPITPSTVVIAAKSAIITATATSAPAILAAIPKFSAASFRKGPVVLRAFVPSVIPVRARVASLPVSSLSASSSRAASMDLQPLNIDSSSVGMLWVDKYRPRCIGDLIGMQAHVQKLLMWLKSWNSIWRSDNAPVNLTSGDMKKAVLLSGHPGVGKTSMATIIANQLGYEVISLNASDARGQKIIKQSFSHVVGNQSMSHFFREETVGKDKVTSSSGKMSVGPTLKKDTLLIMDEVDGMSSGDRGGMSELLLMIRHSKIPIIAICNDRQSPKIKSLSNYCLDIRISKPQSATVAKKLKQIADAEGMTVATNSLENIVAITNGDIRQAITMLYMWRRTSNQLSYLDTSSLKTTSNKDIERSLFDVPSTFFRAPQAGNVHWMDERIEGYFFDSSIMPLFVQDNYVLAVQGAEGNSIVLAMESLARASDAISQGAVVEKKIATTQDYGMAQLHGVLSCITPGFAVGGSMSSQSFHMWIVCSWFGKNSTRGKNIRLIGELAQHLGHRVSGGATALVLDYFPVLRKRFTAPLMNSERLSKEELAETFTTLIDDMNEFNISKEDWDTLTTLNTYQKFALKMSSAAKTQFTKLYNKNGKVFDMDDLTSKSSTRGGRSGGDDSVDMADDDGIMQEHSQQTGADGEEANSGDDDSDDSFNSKSEKAFIGSKLIKMKPITELKPVAKKPAAKPKVAAKPAISGSMGSKTGKK